MGLNNWLLTKTLLLFPANVIEISFHFISVYIEALYLDSVCLVFDCYDKMQTHSQLHICSPPKHIAFTTHYLLISFFVNTTKQSHSNLVDIYKEKKERRKSYANYNSIFFSVDGHA